MVRKSEVKKIELLNILIILKCDKIIKYGDFDKYNTLDINDKEVQYEMLNYNAELYFLKSIKQLKKLKRNITEYYFTSETLLRKNSKKYEIIYKSTIIQLSNLLKKYNKKAINQHNICNFYNDETEINKCLKKYEEFLDMYVRKVRV